MVWGLLHPWKYLHGLLGLPVVDRWQGGHISKAFLSGVQSQEKAAIILQPPAPSAVRWGLWDPPSTRHSHGWSPGWQWCHPALEFSWMKCAVPVPHPAGVSQDWMKEFFPLCLFKAPVEVRAGSLLWDKRTPRCHSVTPCVLTCKQGGNLRTFPAPSRSLEEGKCLGQCRAWGHQHKLTLPVL